MKTTQRWLIGVAVTLLAVWLAVLKVTSIAARRVEPMARERTIRYLRERFDSEVEVQELHISIPRMSALDVLWRRGRGVKVGIEAAGISMRRGGDTDTLPLFSIRRLHCVVDLGVLTDAVKSVDTVSIEGIQIIIPPKGERAGLHASDKGSSHDRPEHSNVVITHILIQDGSLTIVPRDKAKEPLLLRLKHVHLQSLGTNGALHYDAYLSVPRPAGEVHAEGKLGPWTADEPGDTPLNGAYTFEHADLGVFNSIAGTLESSGTFAGSLSSVHASGDTRVPNFRMKKIGNGVPLSAHFDALIDGTNGDTILEPVMATLGTTAFTTTGAVIKHETRGRGITLQVSMPNGHLRDLLRLTAKGKPFAEGRVALTTKIEIPPLTGAVKDKLMLDGHFQLRDAKFLRSDIQDQIDRLSQRGQGQPHNPEIDQVVSSMGGVFRLENQSMSFRSLTFVVAGAEVRLTGSYNLDLDVLDLQGALKLDAKLSQTMTGWKRWALKPVDPFFAKNGAGTFLRIRVNGTSRQPKFGLLR